jgi:hypothetical protein
MFGGVESPAPCSRDCARPCLARLDGYRRRHTERLFACLDIDGIIFYNVQAKASLQLFRVHARSPRQFQAVLSCRERTYPSMPQLVIVLSFPFIVCRCGIELAIKPRQGSEWAS